MDSFSDGDNKQTLYNKLLLFQFYNPFLATFPFRIYKVFFVRFNNSFLMYLSIQQ